MVEKYRRGDGAQHLAVVFGCSPNTVIRAVKAAMGPEEYERLKDRRGRRPGQAPAGDQGAAAQGNLLQDADSEDSADQREAAAAPPLAAESAAPAPLVAVAAAAPPPPQAPAIAEPEPEAPAVAGGSEGPAAPMASEQPAAPTASEQPAATASTEPAAAGIPTLASAAPLPPDTATSQPLSAASRLPDDTEPDTQIDPDTDGEAAGPGVLAIDDADDFGEEDDDLLADDDGEDPTLFVPVPLLDTTDSQAEVRPRPLEAAELPLSAYMLVDKTVELQPRPLRDITELGRLPEEELERRALQVYVNPRQAKRLCGRTQRVIKIPDTAVLTRTAPYLLAQGISRVVIEGALFALPGS